MQTLCLFTVVPLLLGIGVGSVYAECPSECVCVPGTDPKTGNEEWIVNCVEPSHLPMSWPEDIQPITEIYFTGLDEEIIPGYLFQNFASLRRLAIRFSKLGKIDSNAFSGINGLQGSNESVLMLAYTDIGTIESQAFESVRDMASIQIIGGSIGVIKSEAFVDLNNIGSVIVSGVNIKEIESNAFAPNLLFNPGFDLPSHLNAIPEDVIQVFQELNATGFTGCENLMIKDSAIDFVSFVSNTIGKISTGAFAGVVSPNLLNLYGNNIGLVQSGIFGDARKPSLVTFSSNTVEGLATRAFQGLEGTNKFLFSTNVVNCTGEDALAGIEAGDIIESNNSLIPVSPSDDRPNCQAVLPVTTTIAMTTTVVIESTTESSTGKATTSSSSKATTTTQSTSSVTPTTGGTSTPMASILSISLLPLTKLLTTLHA